MKLYGISTGRFIIESEEIIKETAKCYYVKRGNMSAYNYKRQILKDDPILALSPAEAYAKFEAMQLARIERLKENILDLDESINKASDALEVEER